jgi:hypothetical protein
MCRNPAFASIDNLFYWFEWNRVRLIDDSVTLSTELLDKTRPSLPRYEHLSESKTKACHSVKYWSTFEQITLNYGLAIANLRVLGTGWHHATLYSGNSIISTAIEDISNTFDLFKDPTCCLKSLRREPFTVDSKNAVAYDIVDPIESDFGFAWSYIVNTTTKTDPFSCIQTDAICNMIELGKIDLCSDKVDAIDTCLDKVDAVNPCLEIKYKEIIISVPFVKHCGDWKLELDHPIPLRLENAISVIHSRSLEYIDVPVYLYCTNLLRIDKMGAYLHCGDGVN